MNDSVKVSCDVMIGGGGNGNEHNWEVHHCFPETVTETKRAFITH